MSSVKIEGHASHVGTEVLLIEGRSRGNNDTNRLHDRDSKTLYEFLRSYLPSGTLDRLSARLCSNALDQLINSGRLDENGNTSDVREAVFGWVYELDDNQGDI